MIRVLIVDDQALVRSGFRMILEYVDGIEVVGEGATGDEGVRLAADLRPDVVLMDIRMPGMDGIEATERIVASQPSCKVIVLTTFDADDFVFGALRAGASGFLLKDVSPEGLVEGIHAVVKGDAALSPAISRLLIDDIARHPIATPRQLALERLTEREEEVFRLLARGLSNAEIGAALFVGEATVKTHVARVLMKLDLRDRVQAVIAAYEAGFVRPGE